MATKPMTFILKDTTTTFPTIKKHKLTPKSAMIVKDTTNGAIIKHKITEKTKMIVKDPTTGVISAVKLWK